MSNSRHRTLKEVKEILDTIVRNEKGQKVWHCELDIYDKVRNLQGERSFISFRYQGQYEDVETELYYNRFRYYSPDTGTYISQDPIGLKGGNKNIYSYVNDVNIQLDPHGLDPIGTGGYSVYALYENGAEKPFYIGITKQDVDTRMDQHIDSGRYGDNTTHKVLHNDITIEKARGYEQHYIEKYKTKTGKIGQDLSVEGLTPEERGNKVYSFEKTRTDDRGKAFKKEYDNIVKGCS